MKLVEIAKEFALQKHQGQFRKGTNIPYFTHLLSTAEIVKNHGFGETEIAAALLHDTLEDTETTEVELIDNFGNDVARIVKSCSEPNKKLSWKERKLAFISSLKNLDSSSLAVILADKIDNLISIRVDIRLFEDSQAKLFQAGHINQTEFNNRCEHFSQHDFWKKFNAPRDEQIWYYSSIAAQIQNLAFDCLQPMLEIMNNNLKSIFPDLIQDEEVGEN
jgi:hypothetical protein